jgi:hypothetical protein
MLTDVRERVFKLQEPEYALFFRDAAGSVRADPNLLIPNAGIQAAGWRILDPDNQGSRGICRSRA